MSGAAQDKKQLADYTDFRAYLADWLTERKAAGLPVSNRWFALKMGVNSSSWLTSLLHGKKNLSKESANRLSALMKHDAFETRIFESLVFFNQARSIEERNRYYSELSTLRKTRSIKLVAENQYEFYANWYNSAVRSLIGMRGFDGDFAALASQVSPPISPAQAKKSVQLLEKLGFIKKDGTSGYVLADSAITTSDEVRSLAVANFQQETMRLAQEAFDRFGPVDRDIRTLTIGVSRENVDKVKDILAQAREKIVELANGDEAADRVYQVNMQVFPLSKPTETREKRK